MFLTFRRVFTLACKERNALGSYLSSLFSQESNALCSPSESDRKHAQANNTRLKNSPRIGANQPAKTREKIDALYRTKVFTGATAPYHFF